MEGSISRDPGTGDPRHAPAEADGTERESADSEMTQLIMDTNATRAYLAAP